MSTSTIPVITAPRKTLQSALDPLAQLAPARSPHPFTQNVLLVHDGRECWLTATNMETTIRMRVDGVTGGDPLTLAVPARRLFEATRALPDDDVSVRMDGPHVIVAGNRDKFKLPAHDPADFPEWRGDDADPVATVPCRQMANALDVALSCAAEERTRYSLNGVYVDLADGLRLVGSDGKAIAYKALADKAEGGHGQAIIPLTAAKLAARALDRDGDCALVILDSAALFASDGMTMRCQLVAGLYPPYRQVLPDTNKHPLHVTLDRAKLIESLRRLAVAKGERDAELKTTTQVVRWTITPGRVSLVMAGDDCTGDSWLEADTDAELTIGLDRVMMVNGLAGSPDRVTLMFKDANSPVVATEGDWYFMAMPHQLGCEA